MQNSDVEIIVALGSRLRELRSMTGLTQAELGVKIGVSLHMISRYERGDVEPTIPTLHRIVAALKPPPERGFAWLVSGEQRDFAQTSSGYVREMGAEYAAIRADSSNAEGVVQGKEDFVFVPLFNVSAAAGGGSIVGKEEVVDYLAFRKSWFLKMGLHEGSAAIISIVGDSMEPQLRPNDLVLLNTNEGGFSGDGIYAVQWGGELYVKRLQRISGGALRMVSENTAYEPVIIPQSEMESVKVIGRVVWVGRQV